MFPVLFHWKFITIHTYGLFAALGFLFGGMLAARWAARHGGHAPAVSDGLLPILAGGLLGARIAYVALHPGEFSGFWEFFKVWQGGLMWQGGFLGGCGAAFLHFRRRGVPLRLAADVLAPGVALGHGLGRIGCFFAGCCYGRACELPWAVTFKSGASLAPAGQPLHPAQLYDAALQFVTLGVLTLAARREKFKPGAGRLAALYVGMSAAARLAVEFFRNDDRGPLFGPFTPTQAAAAVMLVLAAGAYAALGRRP